MSNTIQYFNRINFIILYLGGFILRIVTCKMSRQDKTFSCLKNIIILSSRKTRFELTKLWKTFGSFLRATRFPSRGSVTDQTTPKAPYPIGRSGWYSAPLEELFPKIQQNTRNDIMIWIIVIICIRRSFSQTQVIYNSLKCIIKAFYVK